MTHRFGFAPPIAALLFGISLAVPACSGDGDANGSPKANTPTAPSAKKPRRSERPARPALERHDPLPALVRHELKGVHEPTRRRHGEPVVGSAHARLRRRRDARAVSRSGAEALASRSWGRRNFERALTPPEFFDLQDELHSAASDLRDAAGKNDDPAIATHFARITSTCIRCHALYLRMPSDKAPASEK